VDYLDVPYNISEENVYRRLSLRKHSFLDNFAQLDYDEISLENPLLAVINITLHP
jgi:hypothetical protein